MASHLHLIDSTIWIGLIRTRPEAIFVQRLDELTATARAATNGMIMLEVKSGAPNDDRFAQYGRIFDSLVQLPVGEETWQQAARIGYELRRKGLTPSAPDLLIAASALMHGAVLMHADSDFDAIAQRYDLRVESSA